MDEVPTFTETRLAQTAFVRIPITGPKPWNQLVFISCESLGRKYTGNELFRHRMRFSSQFQIEDFKQSQLDWYQAHTYIAATKFTHRVYTNVDLNYIVAAEDIKGYVDPDGRIGFETQIAVFNAGAPLVKELGLLNYRFSVSAYVLLYEPAKPPPIPVPPTKPGWMPKIEELPSQFRRPRDFRITVGPSVLDK